MLWSKKHGKNYEWYLEVAARGVNVKALQSFPQLIEIDLFFLDMYNMCGSDFKSIIEYCRLYSLTDEEVLEAVKILTYVHNGVLNASNTA